jgi:hypothetical protein
VPSDPPPAAEQERLIAEHEAQHGPLPGRILAELRAGSQQAGAAADALRLDVAETPVPGPRALKGHVLGLRLLIPAEGAHGPRETPALLYLFGDAIAIRPTDDAPMSAVPLYGLHLVMPHVAVARWVYKAGRTAHANVDLEKDERGLESSLASWTTDDFRAADEKVQVFPLTALDGPVHVYQHLGLARVTFVADKRQVRLKSALPETSDSFEQLWHLFAAVFPPTALTPDPPADHPPTG